MTAPRVITPPDAQSHRPCAAVHGQTDGILGTSTATAVLEGVIEEKQHLTSSVDHHTKAAFHLESYPAEPGLPKGGTNENIHSSRPQASALRQYNDICPKPTVPCSTTTESQGLGHQQRSSKGKPSIAGKHGTRSGIKHKSIPSKGPSQNVRKQNPSKTRKKVPQGMQAQWRVGVAPSVALALSKEESQMSKVISQATAFHSSMFEVFWGPSMHANPFIFDLDNRIEIFRDSSVTATSLVAAGRSQSAQEVLDRVLPSMDNLLRNPHPALYLILAELALGLVKTPVDALRDQIRQYLAARALCILGVDHPITVLLTLRLPQSRKEMLGDRLWKIVLPILTRKFGADHYQSSTQVFCQARNMAACGRSEEAIRSMEQLIDRWIEFYGGNSLIVCYTKIELANILVAAGFDMKAEFVISDALRTSDMIYAAELKDEDCHASEKRHRESSIAFPRVAGYRTLGRLHSLRGNFGAATHYYSQAVAVGTPALGRNSAVVQLAQSDLDSARTLQLKQSFEQFSLADMANLTNIVASPIC